MRKEGEKRAREHFRQAVKTGIAGVVSLCLAELFSLREGYWAVISAVIVMQSSIGAAISAAWSRMAGTAIGAFMGAIFAALWGVNALSFGFAVTITVLVCAFLGLLDSYRLASATVAIVMLFAHADVTWIVALHRFLEVSLGVVVALLVTVFIWPSRARKNLHHGIADAIVLLHSLYDAAVSLYMQGIDKPAGELRTRVSALVQNNESLLKQTMYEPRLGPEHKELLMLLMEHTHRILHAVDALEQTVRESSGDTLNRKFEPELGELAGRIGRGLVTLADEVRAWKFSLPGDELMQAVSALEAKAVEVRGARLMTAFDLEEILHLFSFFHSLRNLARELDMAREAGGRWRATEI
ncbi:MAG TPA: FUSC family protein [Geobacteraceae bacterium]|nr:FUSC family protein [Geobacteraceae bacterium]